MDLLIRFLIGGVIVSAFALLGDLFSPKSFGGLFGAAPSVALATLGLAVMKDGRSYTAIEARSMIAGSAALLVYAALVSGMLVRTRMNAKRATLLAMPVWFVLAFGGWALFLR
jgi:uncharacterized membrane protein (GlpM family)